MSFNLEHKTYFPTKKYVTFEFFFFFIEVMLIFIPTLVSYHNLAANKGMLLLCVSVNTSIVVFFPFEYIQQNPVRFQLLAVISVPWNSMLNRF